MLLQCLTPGIVLMTHNPMVICWVAIFLTSYSKLGFLQFCSNCSIQHSTLPTSYVKPPTVCSNSLVRFVNYTFLLCALATYYLLLGSKHSDSRARFMFYKYEILYIHRYIFPAPNVSFFTQPSLLHITSYFTYQTSDPQTG